VHRNSNNVTSSCHRGAIPRRLPHRLAHQTSQIVAIGRFIAHEVAASRRCFHDISPDIQLLWAGRITIYHGVGRGKRSGIFECRQSRAHPVPIAQSDETGLLRKVSESRSSRYERDDRDSRVMAVERIAQTMKSQRSRATRVNGGHYWQSHRHCNCKTDRVTTGIRCRAKSK
jgi:uncharacterized protein YbjQ (UPF0145 family)